MTDTAENPRRGRRFASRFLPALLGLALVLPAAGQDLEPRRWSHLPVGVNFAGVGYAYTEADVMLDPVLELDDVRLDLHTVAAKFIRTFALLGRSARIEVGGPYQYAKWEGLLQREEAEATREGFGDPVARLAMNLVGGPPLKVPEFAAYRAAHRVETVVGMALHVQAPLGDYHEDKLLNLGENRYTLRPELGVEHTRGKWQSELTGSVAFFTENHDFWGGNQRKQDPMAICQAHLAYVFRPGLWISGGVGYGGGGESRINGISKDDTRSNLIAGCSAGVPINPTVGVKLGYLNSQTQTDTGSDSETVAIATSVLW